MSANFCLDLHIVLDDVSFSLVCTLVFVIIAVTYPYIFFKIKGMFRRSVGGLKESILCQM
jgi:uncharacterized membrane protein YagU involved in acid resistance